MSDWAGGGLRKDGGTVWNTLKRGGGGTEKRGGKHIFLKKEGGKLGQGVDTLKRGGMEPSYELYF